MVRSASPTVCSLFCVCLLISCLSIWQIDYDAHHFAAAVAVAAGKITRAVADDDWRVPLMRLLYLPQRRRRERRRVREVIVCAMFVRDLLATPHKTHKLFNQSRHVEQFDFTGVEHRLERFVQQRRRRGADVILNTVRREVLPKVWPP